MKKFFVPAVEVALLFVVFASVAIAQIASNQDLYTVQAGDCLYTLEGNYSGQPMQWARLFNLNPFLKEPGRVWTDTKNRTIVLIRPGEQLKGLKEMGIIPNPYPLSQLKVATTSVAPTVETPEKKSISPWWWLLLIIPAVLIFWYIRATRNPVTAGPPVVPDGVTDQTVANMFGASNSNVRVRDVVKGCIYGLMQVRYGDGKSRHLILTGQTGYRAMVSRDNGPWTEEYMLQGCGNDLKVSGGAKYVPGLGFRFVPEEVVETKLITPQPDTSATTTIPTRKPDQSEERIIPQPVETSPTPTGITTPIDTDEIKSDTDQGEKSLTFRPASKGRPNLLESKGFESLDIEIKENRTTIRFS